MKRDNGTWLALGAAALVAGVAVAGSRPGGRGGSRAPLCGEVLPDALLRVLDEHEPEVAIRVVFLMEDMPGALLAPGWFSATKKEPGDYLDPRGVTQIRVDLAIVKRRESGEPEFISPNGQQEEASLVEVVAWLRKQLEARTWYRDGGLRVDCDPESSTHWAPYVPWVAKEVARVVRDLPPVFVRGNWITAGYNGMVELDQLKLARLIAYIEDVGAYDLRNEGRFLQSEQRRWKKFNMAEIFSRKDPRDVDASIPTGLVALGGRRIPDMNRYSLSAPRRGLGFIFGDDSVGYQDGRYNYTLPSPVPTLISLHLKRLWGALSTIQDAALKGGWPSIQASMASGDSYDDVEKLAKRLIRRSNA
jgi:hypothetical protein